MQVPSMRNLRILAVPAGVLLLVVSGCTSLQPSAVPADQSPNYQWISSTVPTESCVPLGPVSGSADCECYDKMSYDNVRGKASSNLRERALAKYPDSDLIQVSNVELYLNSAVAHGVAYRCVASAQRAF
jgi:hypothetical protein